MHALTSQLPDDSRTRRAASGNHGWSWPLELQALTVEALDGVCRALVVANHQRAGKNPPGGWKPLRIDHPDRPKPSQATASGGLKGLGKTLQAMRGGG